MLPTIPALLLLFQTVAASPPTAAPGDAYLDETARELVRLARERSRITDRSITAYRTLARERISMGVRALRRDRVLFRREIAARIFWRRGGTGRVEMLGARQVTPVVAAGVEVPSGMASSAAHLAFDPGQNALLRGLSDDDGSALQHPLSDGAEAVYRYATGDTTRIRLSDRRELRLVELRVLPRDARRVPVRGSIWLDLDSHAAVRAAFDLVRPVNLISALDDDEEEDEVPGILQPLELDLRYLTIDYALWGGRWWLPRTHALEGEARVGGLARIPVRFERAYEEFEVEGEGTGPVLAALADSVDADTTGLTPEQADSVAAATGKRPRVSVVIRRRCRGGNGEEWDGDGNSGATKADSAGGTGCSTYRVIRPADSVLVASEHLPGSIYEQDESLVSDREVEEMVSVLKASLPDLPGVSPWQRPELRLSVLKPRQMRYNRVEGLSLPASARVELGPLSADATVRIGTADRDPGVELGVGRSGFAIRQRVAAYRRLAAIDTDRHALSTGSSLSALLFGRDDADYFRATGAEVLGSVEGDAGWDARWRLFAERQGAVRKHTDFSLARSLGRPVDFVDNLAAAEADQAGASVTLGVARGLNPAAFRWRAEASVLGSVGDFDFVRPSLLLGAGVPLPAGVVAAVEAAAGTAFGAVPVQSEWFLGGASTVRGYGAGSRASGRTFWRGRGELGTAAPGGRLILFSDAGWAGEADALTLEPSLLSAGVGVSVMDGLIRLDLARALRGHTGWRLDLHLDAPL